MASNPKLDRLIAALNASIDAGDRYDDAYRQQVYDRARAMFERRSDGQDEAAINARLTLLQSAIEQIEATLEPVAAHSDEANSDATPAPTPINTAAKQPRLNLTNALGLLGIGALIGAGALYFTLGSADMEMSASGQDLREPAQLGVPEGRRVRSETLLTLTDKGDIMISDTSEKDRQNYSWSADGVEGAAQITTEARFGYREDPEARSRLYFRHTSDSAPQFDARLTLDLSTGRIDGTLGDGDFEQDMRRDGDYWIANIPLGIIPKGARFRATFYPIWVPANTGTATISYVRFEPT